MVENWHGHHGPAYRKKRSKRRMPTDTHPNNPSANGASETLAPAAIFAGAAGVSNVEEHQL